MSTIIKLTGFPETMETEDTTLKTYNIEYRELRIYEAQIQATSEEEAELLFLHGELPCSYVNNHGQASDSKLYIDEVKEVSK